MRSDSGDWIEINREEFYALISRNRIAQPLQQGQARISGINEEEVAILARATRQDHEQGNARYRILQRYHSGETPEQLGTPYRTLRNWEAKCEEAERKYGHGYIGLLTHYQRSGNPKRKLPSASLEAMQKYVVNDYETDKQKSKVHSWGQMVKYCEENGIHAPSYKTYCKEIAKRGDYEQTLKRKGRRAAYQVEVPYLLLEYNTPRHGDFPWQIVHLDHGQPDIQLASSRTNKVLGKPWETAMVDAYSRRTLAVYVSYDPPSYRSDMMVLRECVRRYKRLPQILVVDGGADFNSTYFESLLAYYNITKFERPSAEPRAGSPIERLFGTTHTSFIYNLQGNTQASKQVREMTRSVDPRNKAVWTLSAFYRRLCQWCYDVYDTSFHSTLERSPREEYEAGMGLGGIRPYRQIEYDKRLFMMTLPASERLTAKVVYRKGVQVHYEFYWCEKFRDSEVVGTDVELRYDPFDVSRVFALVKGEWTLCIAANYIVLRNHSERELQLISAELRKRQTVSAQQYQIRIKHIAEFIASVEAEELLGIQRLQDAESRDILQIIDPSYADQFSLFQAPALPLDAQDIQENKGDEGDGEDDRPEEAEIYGEYE